MRSFMFFCLVTLMCAALTACGGGGDETALEDTVDASDTPLPVESADLEEPEPEPIALPEGFPEAAPMLAELDITSVETQDAGKQMFKVVGHSTLTVDEVLEYYEKVFAETGWKVEGSSAWKEMTVISASKDGLFVMIESNKGGPNSIVDITTANL